jgi:hypothetical protein
LVVELQLMRAAAGGFGDGDGDGNGDGRAISAASTADIEAPTTTASLPEEDRTKCGPSGGRVGSAASEMGGVNRDEGVQSAKGEKNLWTEATYARVEQILFEVRLFLCLHGIFSLNHHLRLLYRMVSLMLQIPSFRIFLLCDCFLFIVTLCAFFFPVTRSVSRNGRHPSKVGLCLIVVLIVLACHDFWCEQVSCGRRPYWQLFQCQWQHCQWQGQY